MKIVSLILSAALVLGMVVVGSSNNNVYAGDAGWYAAGGLFAGLVAGAIINDSCRPRYYYPRRCYPRRYYRRPYYVRPRYAYRPARYYYPPRSYNTYRTYSYATSPYTNATVYENEIVTTW